MLKKAITRLLTRAAQIRDYVRDTVRDGRFQQPALVCMLELWQ